MDRLPAVRRWIENSPITIGVGLIVVGLVVVFLAWNGAAGKDFVAGQFPYLISGGIGGLVVVGAGLTTILVQTRRRDTEELARRLDQVIEFLQESAAYPTAHGPTAVPDGADVVAGRSTFHDPACRIVDGREDFRPLSTDAARARGLTPCRVCRPEADSA